MSIHFKLKGLKEQRCALADRIKAIGDVIHREKRSWTAEEREQFNKLKAEFERVEDEIRATEAAEDGILPGIPGRGDKSYVPRAAADDDDERTIGLALQGWARRQYGVPLTDRQERACRIARVDPGQPEFCFPWRGTQKRNVTTSTGGAGGGYTVAQSFSNELTVAMKNFSGVRGACREVQTDTVAAMPWPTVDDTSNAGELLSEVTEVAYQDPTFASVTFGSYKFSSKMVLVSAELLQDSAFNLEVELGRLIGERIGRPQGPYFATGTGSSQPKGVVACAGAGPTTANATAFTADELTKLAHSVDSAYRQSPQAGYMMKDDVLAYALMLKDSAGRPLLRDSYAEGAGSNGGQSRVTINGFPVYVNPFMTGLTSSAPVTATKHVLFGDFSKFIVRDAGPIRIRRLDERYAELDKVGFVAFLRSDSNCIDGNAIKYLLQA